jgi:hypothetical protein
MVKSFSKMGAIKLDMMARLVFYLLFGLRVVSVEGARVGECLKCVLS